MSYSLLKANITGIGLHSNFALMQYFGEGGIEILAVPEKDRTVDIQEGLEIGLNLKFRTASKEDAQCFQLIQLEIEASYNLL